LIRGEKSPFAKLKESDISEIKRLRKTKTLRAIGAIYGISKNTVHQIVLGKKWRHVA
jgi:hypothetical protein